MAAASAAMAICFMRGTSEWTHEPRPAPCRVRASADAPPTSASVGTLILILSTSS